MGAAPDRRLRGSRRADAAALTYLEYLKAADRSILAIQNRVKFWATPLQEHSALPESVRFFRANFPEVDLDTHRPTVIVRKVYPRHPPEAAYIPSSALPAAPAVYPNPSRSRHRPSASTEDAQSPESRSSPPTITIANGRCESDPMPVRHGRWKQAERSPPAWSSRWAAALQHRALHRCPASRPGFRVRAAKLVDARTPP